MDVSLLIMAMAFGTSIQMCQINGVPTFTDRNDVCDEGQPVELSGGTFSMVDAWVGPEPAEASSMTASQPERIIIERYIEQPIYLPQPEPVYYVNYNRRFKRQRPSYPYLPDLTPSLYRDRVGHAIMPHQRQSILGKRYQSGRFPALRPGTPATQRQHDRLGQLLRSGM